jgi:hypothetical protein
MKEKHWKKIKRVSGPYYARGKNFVISNVVTVMGGGGEGIYFRISLFFYNLHIVCG